MDDVAYLLNHGMTLEELERLSQKEELPIAEIAAAARSIIERGGSLTDEDGDKPPKLATISADALQRKEIAPVVYIVDRLITQGLTILASPPKYGKSWMVLDLCINVANGWAFLGYKTHACTCLYLALEDSERRLKTRMEKLLMGLNAPGNFHFATAAGTTDNGLLDELDGFVKDHPDTRLIVVDTLQRVRGNTFGKDGAYSTDYKEIGLLKAFADQHHVALVLVHHLRKMADDGDPFNRISGTTAISGAADTMIVLSKQKRSDSQATLSAVGRDIEPLDLTLEFDAEHCVWKNMGDTEALAEQRARDEYMNSPLVVTVKKLLEQSADHRWSGTASDLMAAGQFMARAYLAPNTKALGKAITSMERLMLDYDGILHTTTGNGNAGRRHHFSYQDAPEFTELTDADQEELPFS